MRKQVRLLMMLCALSLIGIASLFMPAGESRAGGNVNFFELSVTRYAAHALTVLTITGLFGLVAVFTGARWAAKVAGLLGIVSGPVSLVAIIVAGASSQTGTDSGIGAITMFMVAFLLPLTGIIILTTTAKRQAPRTATSGS
ncbi:MAG: hypothetical protein FWD83_01350 [Promicromonosporaceae bacterium]|nr:hypothetical protein [Promicromonosporaceae bacterium]